MALQHGTSSEEVMRMQQHLNQMGFQCPASGSYDDATYQAVAAFQANAGLGQTGQADDDTLAAIQERLDAGFGSEDYGDVAYDTPSAAAAELPDIA